MRAVPKQKSALDFFPSRITYPSLNDASKECRGCDLYKVGTQTVFGEGKVPSELMFVGEVPGDEEDIKGRPFVGPAGRLFNNALEEAGIDRSKTYVTNVVKHFKWHPAPRGKRRIHDKPNAAEIRACTPWLGAEIKLVHPRVLVCLGATAAQALLGKEFRVTKQRGDWVGSEHAERTMATLHPSAILRAPDPAIREEQYRDFVRDLVKISRVL
jgi:uracil-DNA glycosylase family protein